MTQSAPPPKPQIVTKDDKRYLQTSQGTELPILNLKGKDYLQVAHRLVWFREEHPNWTIQTRCLEHNTEKLYAIHKAWIIDDKGRTIADGSKLESVKHFADYYEKSQTSAIGRALANSGYGTQFAPDLDEGERLADSPVEAARKPEEAAHMTSVNQVCTHCGGSHLIAAFTKPDNPRNPNRPYWKCGDCPPEQSFSHWVKQD